MIIVKRELSITEQVLQAIDDSKLSTTERIEYIELTPAEYNKIYADVTSGAVKFDGQYYGDLVSKRSLLGVPLRVVEELPEATITPLVRKRGK